jgi:hypothetical protein
VSWDAIGRMGIVLRPFDDPPPSSGTPSPFDAPLGATLRVLARELDHLDAKTIVLQVGYRDQDLRMDGMPRSNARMVHDAVALSFESKWGPLRYETNEFVKRFYRQHAGEGWQQNLRAIALGMEALRKVDRYGVSKRGEQYTGWRALPQADNSFGLYDAATAREWLTDTYGGLVTAIKATHPDTGGDADEFRKVMRAKELIEA